MNSCIKNVQLLNSTAGENENGNNAGVLGTLHILGTHFVFKSTPSEEADSPIKEIWVVHTLIASVDKSPPSVNGSRLTVRCKHFLVLIFMIPKEKECQNVFNVLSRCSKLLNVNDLFAFVNKNGNPNEQPWKRIDWDEEFRRQGVNDAWKESNFNQAYAYCDTYPEKLWFPAGANMQMLIGSCKFRSKARLPVLTYFYRPNSAAICRSSQPLSGFSTRCVEDENLIEMIMQANPSSSTLYLVDTRPRVNAMVNKVQGKGFEDSRNYTNIQFHFFDIENIHVMRASFNKLLEACQKQQTITQYLKAVESSGWLKHLRTLLECSNFLAESILRGISCVVHCSDGWDRTSQTVSLAQLIIDPFYRTIKGFQVLIDKDWLGFGFKFDDRCGHLGIQTDESEREISPIFTQFLDAVFQLMRNRPLSFEFNERFLLDLNEHAYSCVYGLFIGNCDKDRKDLRITSRTMSLWSHIDANMKEYKNAFYEPDSDIFFHDNELQPSSIVVWSAMYNRFDTGIQPREYFPDIGNHIKQRNALLAETIKPKIQDDGTSMERISATWQSGVNADECSNENCKREFLSRFEWRQHCYSCGKIYCRQCFKPPPAPTTNTTDLECDTKNVICLKCRLIK